MTASLGTYWYKHPITYRDHLTELLQHQKHSDQPLLNWLNTVHTMLLPNTKDTHIVKNY